MAVFDDDNGREFPPELQRYNPVDGWTDRDEWWDARIDFAREHGTFGRLPSGRGKILPLLQEMAQLPTQEKESD
jgi:hypothetical protein